MIRYCYSTTTIAKQLHCHRDRLFAIAMLNGLICRQRNAWVPTKSADPEIVFSYKHSRMHVNNEKLKGKRFYLLELYWTAKGASLLCQMAADYGLAHRTLQYHWRQSHDDFRFKGYTDDTICITSER